MSQRSRTGATIFLSLLLSALSHAQVSVATQHNDAMRTGSNLRETTLKPAGVSPAHFGMLFKRAVDDQLYTQPLVAAGVKIGGGWHDVVYVTTVNNSVYAFDANDPSATMPLWHVNFGAAPGLRDADFGCVDMNGNMGIVGTPVIDVEKQALYVVTLTKTRDAFHQRLHALDLATGADLPNSPAVIEAPEFDALMENQRPALTLANGRVYIGYASHCDKAPYHGFLLAYDASSLKQTGAYNTSPDGNGGSIWQSGLAPAVDAQGDLYVVSGNGSWNGTSQLSESFLKFDPDLKLLDWFTPSNHFQLDKDDNDINSSGAVLVPGTHTVLGGGKEGIVYLLNTSNLGHLGDEHAVERLRLTGSHLHSLVYWESAKEGKLLYLWGQQDKLQAYRFNKGMLEQTPFQTRPEMNHGHPGAMLSLSANGDRDGILWAAIHATGDSWHESRPGVLHAYEAENITHELWNSLDNPDRDDCGNYSKMAPPTVANGKVFLASFGKQNTGTGQLCVYGLLPAGAAPGAPSGVRATSNGSMVSLEWSAVPGAPTYSVESTEGGQPHAVASGLVRPAFTDHAVSKGTIQYTVVAMNANGASLRSAPASVTIERAPAPRVMH